MTPKELRERMAGIATQARAKFDEITNETPDERAAEIEREFDAMMADHDKLAKRLDQAERLADAEGRAVEAFERQVEERRPNGSGRASGVDTPAGPTYREAFHAYLRAAGSLGDMAPEHRSVLSTGYQQVEGEQRAQTSGTNSAGGFTVPQELLAIIVETMQAWGPMYDPGITQEIVTSGGGVITMPTVDDTAVTAGAHTEGATLTDDGGKDVTFGEKQLEAYAFNTEWLRISKELADDSIFAMETVIGALLGKRLARLANTQLTTGSGSSAPHGIATAAAAGKVANSTTAITWDEIIDLEHSVDPAYRENPNVRYMFNDGTLQAARKLKDGDGNYLWQMGNVQAGVPGSFNGKPYSVNQAMEGLDDGVDTKVMLFGDFGQYYVRKVGAPLIGAIQDKDFWPGFGIAGYIRFDGELADAAAVKALALAAS